MIKKFVLGSYGVNLYVVYDKIEKVAAIVDPAIYDSKVIKFIVYYIQIDSITT